jgi:hypothetical protein
VLPTGAVLTTSVDEALALGPEALIDPPPLNVV